MNAYTMLDNEEFSSLANVRSAMNDMESLEEYDVEYRNFPYFLIWIFLLQF